MKAMLLTQAGKAETAPWVPTALPVPKPGPGQTRILGEACGICRTDLHVAEGDWPADLPLAARSPLRQPTTRLDPLTVAGLQQWLDQY